jgi:class 3 adenylate cyclase/tetratricopeptide (TPR) repeat protein
MSKKVSEQETQLINAMAALESQRDSLGDAVVEASLAALRKQLHELSGESEAPERHKKLVSLLFVDVVGSTKLGQHLEPDEILEIMDGGLRRLAIPIEQFGGRVTRFQGDGFKAVFGEPVTRENDAEMAIRAGLAILENAHVYADELQEKRNISGFKVRVGVNTGMVAVGGYTESDDTVMGLAVNLGARLESAAPPDGLLISHTTYQHVRGIFEVEPLTPVSPKGFNELIKVYLVKGSKPRTFRTKTRGVEGVFTRMIGREAELKRLQDAYYTALEDEECQVVTAIGEAGVGKSRLLEEFEDWLGDETGSKFSLKGRSSPETQESPYSLLRDMFSHRFEIQGNDPVDQVHQKIEVGIGEALGDDDHARMRTHFIGQLLGFDFSDSLYLQGVLDDARQLRDRAWTYLCEYLKAIAEHTPVIIFLEDIHWADDSSLDLISYITQILSKQRLLIICLARPVLLEHRPLWGEGLRSCTRLDLHPLSTRDCRHLVEEILQKMVDVPLALRELVISEADGNPFYIEELIKMLIDSQVILTERERWQAEPSRLAGLLADMSVPTTLTSLIQARLDNLSLEERTILQQASVVGRVFWDNVIDYINSHRNGERTEEIIIPEVLANLRQKEMIFQREFSALSGAQEYTFRHAILREVAYETILKKERQTYHAMVATWLINENAERAGEFTGMIGEHLELAGQTRRAIAFFRQAGEQAARRYANQQALKYLSRALELTPEMDLGERYATLLAREQVFSLLGARQEQKQDLDDLVKLSEALDDEGKQGEVALSQAIFASERSDYPKIIARSQEAIRVAQKLGIPHLESKGNLLWGRALLSQGNYPGAKERFAEALSIAKANELVNLEADSLRKLGNVEERLGKQSSAIDYFERSLQLYRQIGDRRGEGQILNQLGNILLLQGDHEGGKKYYDQFLSISREIGDRWGEGQVVQNIADAYLIQYDYGGASKYFEQALQITREIGNRTIESGALVGLGNIYLEQAEYGKAKTLFEQSLNISREIGNKPWEAKTLSQIGRYFHRQGDYVRAQSYYEQSLEIYRQLGNQLSESRVLTDLSLLYHHLGDDETAVQKSKISFAIAKKLNHPRYLGRALTQVGRALAGLGEFEEATDAYRQASKLLQEIGQDNLWMEVLAGLSLTYQTKGESGDALACVDEILNHLENSQEARLSAANGTPASVQDTESGAVPGLEGTADPLWIYLTCCKVLSANEDQRAETLLKSALYMLQEQASKIEDADLRYSFLNNVKVNREILSASEMGGLG